MAQMTKSLNKNLHEIISLTENLLNCVEKVKTKVLIKRPFEEAGLEESVDVLGDEGRLEGLGVSLDGLSVAVDQKLLQMMNFGSVIKLK
jgi:hypothetical protein